MKKPECALIHLVPVGAEKSSDGLHSDDNVDLWQMETTISVTVPSQKFRERTFSGGASWAALEKQLASNSGSGRVPHAFTEKARQIRDLLLE